MKNLKNCLLFFSLSAFIFFSCTSPEKRFSKAEMRAIVEERNAKLGECFKSGDAEMLASMYTDSAKLCPNGFDFVLGRDSIKAFWAEDFKTSKVVDMETTVFTIDGNIDVIYETGKSSSKIFYNDSLHHFKVKYINIWRRQTNGEYLLDVDFWNSIGR